MVHKPTPTTYLVELYAPRQDREQLKAEAKRIRAAVKALTDSGAAVRYMHAVLVPGEETAFHVFEANGPDSVEQAIRDAGLEPERISPAIAETGKEIPVRPAEPSTDPGSVGDPAVENQMSTHRSGGE